MKIAIVYDMLYPFNVGGIELRNYEVAKQLVKAGHEVHLYGVKLWEGKNVIKKDGIYYHGCCRYKELYNFSGKRRIIEPVKMAVCLFPSLLKDKYDIIECASFPYFPFFSCYFVSKIKRTPLITVWHQYFDDFWFIYFGKLKGFFAYSIEMAVRKLSKIDIVVSKKTKRDLGGGIVIENGIDIEEIRKTKPSKEKSDLIYVGRLIKGKNVELLLKSLPLIKKKYPDIKLLIVGDGPSRKDLETLAVSLKIMKNVKFLGCQEKANIYSLIKSSKIFTFPSLVEGFGMVVTEAFGCGKPVIAIKSKWNASYTLIKNGKNGLVAEDNIESFTEKVINLLDNHMLRKEMEVSAKMGAERYSWEKQAGKLIGVYKNEIN